MVRRELILVPPSTMFVAPLNIIFPKYLFHNHHFSYLQLPTNHSPSLNSFTISFPLISHILLTSSSSQVENKKSFGISLAVIKLLLHHLHYIYFILLTKLCEVRVFFPTFLNCEIYFQHSTLIMCGYFLHIASAMCIIKDNLFFYRTLMCGIITHSTLICEEEK